eukprot:GDKK01052833.1.p1 GENE.GDKK01052833.1~~GDKK01052833.1.p1  ORF type:complete len:161 (+),score=48.73 GDKK01052833.1:29-511(+)
MGSLLFRSITVMDVQSMELVESSWAAAAPLGVDTIGRLFYQRVFEVDPSLLALFSFKDEPDMFNSEKFKTHAAKVINTVGKAVASVRNLDPLVPVLHDMGKRHVAYGVKEEHYDVIFGALLHVLATGLGDKFTDEVKASWIKVADIIGTVMKAGAAEASQ